MIKRGLLVTLLVITLVGMGGCIGKKVTKKYTNEEKKEMVLTHLKEKYGEEFEGLAYTPEQLMKQADSFYVYPKNKSKEEAFEAWGDIQEDGTYKISDSYFGILIHDEYEKVVKEIIGEHYDEFTLYVNTTKYPPYPDRLNKLTKISEIYNIDEFFSPEIRLYLKRSTTAGKDTGKTLEKIADKMANMKLTCGVYTLVIEDAEYDAILSSGEKFGTAKKTLLEKKKIFKVNSNLEIEKNWEVK